MRVRWVQRVAVPLFFSTLFLLVSRNAAARDLTFEDRVGCQEAIERVYYSHQIGATLPFTQAVPREALEKKAR